MHAIWEIFFNHVLIAALIGWFVAQGLKIPIHYLAVSYTHLTLPTT